MDATTFRIAVTDSLAAEAVSGITLRLREASPSARVAFSHHTNAGSLEAIERGTLGCALGMFPALPHGVHVRSLRADHYVCVMRRGHELSRAMHAEKLLYKLVWHERLHAHPAHQWFRSLVAEVYGASA